MKLTDNMPWGVLDQQTGNIVARSTEGYRAADKARGMNRKASWTVREVPGANGQVVHVRELGDRYTVTQ